MNTITLADFQIRISLPWEYLFHGTPPSGSEDIMLNICFLANENMLKVDNTFYMVIFPPFIEQLILIFLHIILALLLFRAR